MTTTLRNVAPARRGGNTLFFTPTTSVAFNASRGLVLRSHGRVRSRRAVSLTIMLLAVIALAGMAALFVSVSGYLAARRERASAG